MNGLWIFAALSLALVGATLLYAASPHQQLARRPLRRSWPAAAGALALLASLLLLLRLAGPATAIFMAATFAMLAWSLVPLALAWWRRPRGGGR